jgi:hypothetical protein
LKTELWPATMGQNALKSSMRLHSRAYPARASNSSGVIHFNFLPLGVDKRRFASCPTRLHLMLHRLREDARTRTRLACSAMTYKKLIFSRQNQKRQGCHMRDLEWLYNPSGFKLHPERCQRWDGNRIGSWSKLVRARKCESTLLFTWTCHEL